jgi:hypothetical protein
MWAAGLCSLAAVAVGAPAARKLIMNGKVVSADVRLINGQPYVALKDLAKATGQTVTVRTGAYELIAAGGANQVEGLNGKVGDTLFDGKWRFRLVDLQKVNSYTLRREGGIDPGQVGGKADIDGKTYRARPGYIFVIANCVVKNGQKRTERFGGAYGEHTALTDTDGSSYKPIGWDQEGGMFATKDLLPGAGQDVAAIFLIPEGKTLKDLVFTLTNISDRNPHDVRVSLGE